MKNLIITFTLLPLFIGCQSASNYLHKSIIPKSQFIESVETGLDKFRHSNYKESTEEFQEAVDIYRVDEDKPLVSFSDMVIFDYHGEGYDKVFLHNYNALNYLLMGDLEGAKVETKNSNFIQQKAREEFYKEIEKFKNTKDNYGSILNRYEKLFKSVDAKHTPYQNPFAYYLAALLFEEDNKYNDALIDIKQALKYQKNSKLLKEKQHLYSYNSKKEKRVELFFDLGKSPLKFQNKVPVKTDKEKENMLYLPNFKIYDSNVEKIILTNSHGKIIKESALLCDIDAIKVNEFKEKLPALISKVFKESAKDILVSSATKKSSVAGGVINGLRTIYSQNNLHTWKSLPKKIEVISFIPKSNESYNLKLIDKDGKILDNQKLTLKFSKKLKNSYQYYAVQEGRFYSLSQEVAR